MLRRRHAAVLVVVLLVLGGCSKGDDSKLKTKGAKGSDADVTSSTTALAGAEGSASTVAGGSAGSGGSGGPGAAGSGASGTGGGAGGATASGSTPAPAFAAAGKYTYEVSGKASSPIAPEQPISGTSTLTVEPPAGTDQRQVTSGDQQNREQIIRDGGSAVQLTYLKLSGQGATSEFKPEPPVVFAPRPLTVGAAWAWTMTSTDGKTKLSGEFKAARTETVDVGGTKVDCIVIEATLQYDGDATATQKLKIWASPQLALPVREEEVTDGKFGTVTFHFEKTSRLVSTKPA